MISLTDEQLNYLIELSIKHDTTSPLFLSRQLYKKYRIRVNPDTFTLHSGNSKFTDTPRGKSYHNYKLIKQYN